MTIHEYIAQHTERGACRCGECIDAPEDPDADQPEGHTVDLHFFKVAKKGEPDAETFKRLIREHEPSYAHGCDPLDGGDHTYIELGAWIGDQGLAMQMMGLGQLLGVWRVVTPGSVMPWIPAAHADELAGRGMVLVTPTFREEASAT